MTENYTVEGQMSIFDQDSWCGRMFREPLVPTKEKTSKRSSQKSSVSSNRNAMMCLCLKKESGPNRESSTMKWVDGQLHGEYMTRSFGEYPREENASHLSQILEDSAQPKYCLSARACTGILNRAEKRGKELPEILKTALENQIKESYTYDLFDEEQ